MSNTIPAGLKEAYEKAISYVCHLMPMSEMDIDSVIAENAMLFGTTIDEEIHGLDEFKQMMRMQAEESEDLDFSFDRHLIFEHITVDGKTGLFIENLKMTIKIDGAENVSHIRLSFVMENIDGSWKLIHAHGSKPVESEEDPWHVKEWEAEKKRLEKKVDEQTADLKQKNQELEIEAASERVRSVAMGMQNPDEILDVLRVVKEEISRFELGHKSTWMWITQENGNVAHWELVDHFLEESLEALSVNFDPSKAEIPKSIMDKMGSEFFSFHYKDDQISKYLDDISKAMGPNIANEEAAISFKEAVESGKIQNLWQMCSTFKGGLIGLMFVQEPPDHVKQVLVKITDAFGLAYRRFEDLQEAERRARESRIESALERIRSQSLAMQSSDELRNVADVLYEQMRKLDQPLLEGSAIHFYKKHDDEIEAWFNMPSGVTAGEHVAGRAFFPKDSCWVTREWLRKYESKEKVYDVFTSKKQQKEWMEVLKSHVSSVGSIARMDEPQPTHMHFVDFSGGAMVVVSLDPISDDTKSLQKRAAAVFDLAYRRYEDLKLAEYQAYESKVEASLERVREMAAAMNHSDDLKQIAEAMFKEMEILKINPLRYGLGIIDREAKEAELWASTVNDGHYLDMLGTLSLTWHPMLRQVFDVWEEQQEEMIYELKGKELNDYYRRVGKVNPEIPDLEKLQDPKTDIVHYVSFFPFKTGTLYAFTDGEPNEDGRSILKRFANVFEQAHIRFGDLQTTEMQALQIMEERDRLADTLKELRSTQEQLVQQEKLASLGQLTAGIAHEIKNPLNFVNNFSEVSIELIEEAREECQRVADEIKREKSARKESGKDDANAESTLSESKETSSNQAPDADPDLILEILSDIEFNLKKINDHGMRADSIVKSMLQHSRGGSGKMEPTKVNNLIKEYANLAFHGMRAGKNAFNLDLDLDLEPDLGDVNLIAEDFSRVLLNLCNNAFDAMRDKITMSSEISEDYLPKLSVRTKRNGSSVIVEVEDNGPGISEDMIHKIMQPFFTTKKGTAGTGLGLSITNDIIKAHGGDLTVKSSPGKGSVFIIKLTA